MFDINHLPAKANVQLFPGVVGNSILTERTWTRPLGTSMALILAVSGGGSGGNGASGAAGSIRGGGGGGGSGSWTRALIMLDALPSDVLFMIIGNGGSPAGVGGSATRVALSNSFDSHGVGSANGSTIAFANASGSGGNGTTSAGTAGTAATAPVITGIGGLFVSIAGAGIAGGAGGAVSGAAGVPPTYSSATLFGGGSGGGSTPAANTNFGGGAIPGITSNFGFSLDVLPPITGGAAGGGAGMDGYVKFNKAGFPYLFTPGSGGGTNGAAGTGGRGGAGGWGCGGGGGGGGVTGGAGGPGGPGFVAIIAF